MVVDVDGLEVGLGLGGLPVLHLDHGTEAVDGAVAAADGNDERGGGYKECGARNENCGNAQGLVHRDSPFQIRNSQCAMRNSIRLHTPAIISYFNEKRKPNPPEKAWKSAYLREFHKIFMSFGKIC